MRVVPQIGLACRQLHFNLTLILHALEHLHGIGIVRSGTDVQFQNPFFIDGIGDGERTFVIVRHHHQQILARKKIHGQFRLQPHIPQGFGHFFEGFHTTCYFLHDYPLSSLCSALVSRIPS